MSQFKQFIESPKGRLALKVTAKVAGFIGTFVVAKAVLGPSDPKPVTTLIVNQTFTEPIAAEPIVTAVKAKAASKAGAKKPSAPSK